MEILPLFSYIGILTVTWYLTKILLFLHLHCNPSNRTALLTRYKHGLPSWALITGASDGIGYGFAQELVRRGFGVVLHGRNQAKLERAQAQLQLEHPGAMVRLLVVDAISASAADLETALTALADLHITILVNNVGGFPPMTHYLKPLTAFTATDVDSTINLNARFLTRMTKLMIPCLTHPTGRSLIINISSGAQIGIPWLVLYSGTKGFVVSFSKALSRELQAEQAAIDVIALTPGDTRSASHAAPLAWNVPDSLGLARATLDCVGVAAQRGMLMLCPFWVHDMLLSLLELVPEAVKRVALVEEMRRKRRVLEKVK